MALCNQALAINNHFKKQKIHLCPCKGQQQMFGFSKCPHYFNFYYYYGTQLVPTEYLDNVFFLIYKSKTPVNFYVVQYPWAKAFLKLQALGLRSQGPITLGLPEP